jgi:hypothetical protein
MHRINHASLSIVTLQPFRWTARAAWHRLSTRRRRIPARSNQAAHERIDSESPPLNGKTPIHLKTPSILKHREAADASASALTSDD